MKRRYTLYGLVVIIFLFVGCSSNQDKEVLQETAKQFEDVKSEVKDLQKKLSEQEKQIKELKSTIEDKDRLLQEKETEIHNISKKVSEVQNEQKAITDINIYKSPSWNSDVIATYYKDDKISFLNNYSVSDELEEENLWLEVICKGQEGWINVDSLKIYDRKKELDIYADIEDLLFWLVVRYDHAWVAYINVGDNDIFNFMIKDSQVYNLAKQFKKNHPNLKERVPQISMRRADVSGNTAKIYIYEEVEEHKNGNVNIKSYNWVYYAKKIDGIWLLEKMIRE